MAYMGPATNFDGGSPPLPPPCLPRSEDQVVRGQPRVTQVMGLRGGGGGWHKALVVGSVSLWRRLLASRL